MIKLRNIAKNQVLFQRYVEFVDTLKFKLCHLTTFAFREKVICL